jgi:hypothetical protein
MENKIYGYLRGSTGDIDKNNQRDAINKKSTQRPFELFLQTVFFILSFKTFFDIISSLLL